MDSFIMKQRYESLPLKELRAIAKQRGIDGISALRKGALIDRLLEEDEKDRQMTGQNDSRNFEEAADVSVPQEVPNAVEEGDGEFGKNTAAENPDKSKKTSRKTACVQRKILFFPAGSLLPLFRFFPPQAWKYIQRTRAIPACPRFLQDIFLQKPT